ncbi:MAG: M28 family peptidase [Armatimonadetes bacterium]|nr:M28 family peptidase [Armatimonadota bacterium]
MKRLGTFALAAVALVGFTSAPDKTLSNEAAKSAANDISSGRLKDFLTFIAADALLGRDTPSPGLDAAANFIAYNLKMWGAKPAGDDGTFFQKIKLEKATINEAMSSLTVGDTMLAYKTDFVAFGGSGKVSGELVYIEKAGQQVDVKNKVVLLAADARSEMRTLRGSGALAIISDSGQARASFPAFVDGMRRFGGGYRPADEGNGQGPAQTLSVTMNSDSFKDLVGKVGQTASLNLEATMDVAYTQNIVAIVEGSDPKLKSEYVAFGAHYDHIGWNPNLKGDQIFNGADDDGSGTCSILNIAEAALKAPARPKRSLLFVWHCGEEKGLWGSAYFNQHPTVPKENIVAQLNIDMIGRSKPAGNTNPLNKTLTGPNAVYVIGTTMMSTRLGEIVHGVNAKYLKIDYDKQYDDPKDPNRFFYRSDHYNYAKNGIPICFWFDGEHEDYHRVGDEVSKIDFNKMQNVARTVFVTGVTVANEATRPKVDKPLDR